MSSSPPSPPSGEQGDMAIHPNRPGRFTLQISEELRPSSSRSNGLSSIRLNHRPAKSNAARIAKIRPSSSGSHVGLTIADNEKGSTESYTYEGDHQKPKKSYVIALDPATGTATLKPVINSYSFNLRSTPTESSAQKLKSKYAQIREKSEDSDESTTTRNVGVPISVAPEDDNPYDFRHYLTRQPATQTGHGSRSPTPNRLAPPKNATIGRDRSVSAPQTPTQAIRSPMMKQPTPTIRLDRKASVREDEIKRNRPLPKKAQPLQVRKQTRKKELSKEYISDSDSDSLPLASTRSTKQPTTSKAEPKQKQTSISSSKLTKQPPTTAAKPQNDDDDSEDDSAFTTNAPYDTAGGLEIVLGSDDESSQPKRPRSRTLPTSTGPISLRSAANSPSSQVQTPQLGISSLRNRMGRLQEENEEVELDIGGGQGFQYEGEDSEEDDDGEGDVDVEPIDLGPPAHVGGDDADYEDLEAAMVRELVSSDDSEESEAE